jgi:hypothetical protein
MPPTSSRRSKDTRRKTGRSTKKWAKRMAGSRDRQSEEDYSEAPRSRTGGRVVICGVTLMPGRMRERPLTTMVSSPFQAGADHPVAVDPRPGPHRAHGHGVVLGDHIDHAPVLIVAHRLVRHEHAGIGIRAVDGDPAEEAGREEEVPVVEHGARPDGAASRVEAVVHEIELPRALALPLVGEGHDHAARALAPRLRAAGVEARIGEVGALVHVEVEVDRVERDDVGEHRRVGVDEVALRDVLARDAPGERRLDLGEFEIELRLPQGGLGPVEIGAGRQIGRAPLVEDLIRDVARAPQGLGALEIVGGELHPHLRRGDGGLGLFQRGAVGTLVDREERVARLDQGAILEVHLVEIARHPRPELDLVHRLETPDELVLLGDVLHHGLRHRDGRHRRRLLGRCCKRGRPGRSRRKPKRRQPASWSPLMRCRRDRSPARAALNAITFGMRTSEHRERPSITSVQFLFDLRVLMGEAKSTLASMLLILQSIRLLPRGRRHSLVPAERCAECASTRFYSFEMSLA